MATIPCSNSIDKTQPGPSVDVTQAAPKKSTHGQILKSSALVGGSSLLNIGIGIVRTKAMAVLLGPAGFGLFGLYNSVANITQTLAGMGVSSSGVRQIADAASSGDEERVARTTVVLRLVSVFLGVLGAAFLIVFSGQISAITFGSRQNAGNLTSFYCRVSDAYLCRPGSPYSGNKKDCRPGKDEYVWRDLGHLVQYSAGLFIS